MFQQTIKNSISLTGIGAHSGEKTTLTLLPAPEHHGIVFKRTDLPEPQNIIPALWSYVSDTKFCTKISNNYNASVATIEHLMAALAAKKIDNISIEVDGPEIPILDGSAKPFFDLLGKVGTTAQKAPRNYLRVLKPITVNNGDVWAEIKPNHLTLSLRYTFRNRGTNTFETYQSQNVLQAFEDELSAARTFGFLEDVQKLYDAGLAKGSSLENAVVFDQGKVMNPEGLRFDNECARHKALDVVGDLYLAGLPIIGAFEGHCSGHSINNNLLRKLLNDRSAWAIEPGNYATKIESYGPSMRLKNSDSSSQQSARFGTY
jgi:UDP-3-O-[3-hydroxymyristoyl] N-acetylglucosamine deacetylase